jgi:hypothetical protein
MEVNCVNEPRSSRLAISLIFRIGTTSVGLRLGLGWLDVMHVVSRYVECTARLVEGATNDYCLITGLCSDGFA